VRRLLPVVVLAVLALPSVARAHVTVLPTYLEQGKRETLVFTAPNERAPHAVTDFTITFPRGVELSAVSPPSGWQLTVVPANARWSGGHTTPGATTEFRIDARTEIPPGAVTVYAQQRYDDGKSVRWTIPFTITPQSGSPAQHLWPAVFAAAAGFVLIVGGLLFVRRRKPQARAG
jgi:uncharacterized protein YcnI